MLVTLEAPVLLVLLFACFGSADIVDTAPPADTDTGCWAQRWTADRDGDGYGRWDPAFPDSIKWSCDAPSGYVLADGDCDDRRVDTYPYAPDPPGDGLDSDCDGIDG